MKSLKSKKHCNVYQIIKKIRGENAMDGNTVWYKEYFLTRTLNFRQVDFEHDSALLTRMFNMKGTESTTLVDILSESAYFRKRSIRGISKLFSFLLGNKITREYSKSLMEEQFPPVILNQDINSENKQKSFKWFYRLFKYASLQGLLWRSVFVFKVFLQTNV